MAGFPYTAGSRVMGYPVTMAPSSAGAGPTAPVSQSGPEGFSNQDAVDEAAAEKGAVDPKASSFWEELSPAGTGAAAQCTRGATPRIVTMEGSTPGAGSKALPPEGSQQWKDSRAELKLAAARRRKEQQEAGSQPSSGAPHRRISYQRCCKTRPRPRASNMTKKKNKAAIVAADPNRISPLSGLQVCGCGLARTCAHTRRAHLCGLPSAAAPSSPTFCLPACLLACLPTSLPRQLTALPALLLCPP